MHHYLMHKLTGLVANGSIFSDIGYWREGQTSTSRGPTVLALKVRRAMSFIIKERTVIKMITWNWKLFSFLVAHYGCSSLLHPYLTIRTMISSTAVPSVIYCI